MALKPDATANCTSSLVAAFFHAVPYIKLGMGTWLEHVKVMMFPPERRRTRIKHFHDPRDESTVLVQFYRNCRVKEEDKALEDQNFILLLLPLVSGTCGF